MGTKRKKNQLDTNGSDDGGSLNDVSEQQRKRNRSEPHRQDSIGKASASISYEDETGAYMNGDDEIDFEEQYLNDVELITHDEKSKNELQKQLKEQLVDVDFYNDFGDDFDDDDID
jgi:hypothetical protein